LQTSYISSGRGPGLQDGLGRTLVRAHTNGFDTEADLVVKYHRAADPSTDQRLRAAMEATNLYSRQTAQVLQTLAFTGALAAMLIIGGCGGNPSTGAGNSSNQPPPPRKAGAAPVAGSATGAGTAPRTLSNITPAAASRLHANELGRVLVMEYHNITTKQKGQFFQSPEQLRNDLNRLYESGYRTIDIHDYINGNITTPAGFSPVVITFDDASPGQFRYITVNGAKKIDPDCAVGILEAFGKSHPGFGNHANFFVLPEGFSQPADKAEKYHYLVTHGFSIGNHTWHHNIMTHMSPATIQTELGYDDVDIHKILPDYTVNVLAYPYGSRPTVNGKKDYTYIANGTWKGDHYHIKAAFLVGAEPAPSPFSTKYKPYALPRVQAVEATGPDLWTHWLEYLKAHKLERFVSDGDPDAVSIPARLAPYLNPAAVGNRKVVKY